MAIQHDLFLHEEVLLLVLHDEKGTVPMTSMAGLSIAGAMVAELLSEGRIEVEATKKKLVNVKNTQLLGDSLLDECLTRIREAKRRATLGSWLSRFSGIRKLHHRIADRLVARGILRREERYILRIFRSDAYPVTDPRPERQVRDSLREAIFRDDVRVDPRTRLLLAACNPMQLLSLVFDRKELKPRRKHIKAIIATDETCLAIEKGIEQAHAAHMAAIG